MSNNASGFNSWPVYGAHCHYDDYRELEGSAAAARLNAN